MRKFKLTAENYYSPKRVHLSQSQIKDYLKSPEFYKAKYLDGKIEKKITSGMQVGKFFDALLSAPSEASKYYIQEKRGDKSPFALSEKEFEEANLLAEAVKSLDFWKAKLNPAFQIPLTAAILEDLTWVKESEIPKGLKKDQYTLVCGLIDRLDIYQGKDGNKFALLSDFKKTTFHASSSPRNWYYHSLDLGYDIQFAMYRKLVSLNFDIPLEDIKCYHITGALEDGFPYIDLFEFLPSNFDSRVEEISRAAWKIKQNFFPLRKLNWGNAKLCGFASEEN